MFINYGRLDVYIKHESIASIARLSVASVLISAADEN